MTSAPEALAAKLRGFHVHPAIDPRTLFDGLAPAWDRLAADPRAVLVKSGKHRNVWRIRSGEGTVYAKVFLNPVLSLGVWGKRLLGLHPAQREWRVLSKLEARGIPAIRAIALGAVRADRNARGMVLVTQGVEDSRTLQQVWEELDSLEGPATQRKRPLVIKAVADLWVAAHTRGFCHPDSHPANVLISEGPGESNIGALFLDPLSPQWTGWSGGPVSRRAVFRSLVMLDQYFRRRASRSDRLRFWREYWLGRTILLDARTERRFLSELARTGEVHRGALARRRDRRLAGDGKYFGRLKRGHGWTGIVALRLERRHVFDERNVADRSIEDWARILSPVFETGDLRVLQTHGLRALRRPVNHRGPWATEKFERAHRLRHRDMAAPLILGFIQRRSLGSIRDEYLILPESPAKHEP